jgi:hypothetical protein
VCLCVHVRMRACVQVDSETVMQAPPVVHECGVGEVVEEEQHKRIKRTH